MESDINGEIELLIYKYLEGQGFSDTLQKFRDEIVKHKKIPKRLDWKGNHKKQDISTYLKRFEDIPSNYLECIVKKVKDATPNAWSGVRTKRSILSRAAYSLVYQTPESSSQFSPAYNHYGSIDFSNQVLGVINAPYKKHVTKKCINLYSRMNLSCRTVGHLSSVYCVLFDRSGNYIITGADDKLVKIWSARDGRLLSTLRSAGGEITDLSINAENTLLAVGSCDKLVRVWRLSNCEQLAVLNAHAGNITSVFFCPIPKTKLNHGLRYLASTSTDGSVAFWAYMEETEGDFTFQSRPTLWHERMRPGNAQMTCASFSTGGLFMAAGSADNNVRVYHMLGADGPERILEVEYHSDRVDSIAWCHEGIKFISGSKDGTAIIWHFINGYWKFYRLICYNSDKKQLQEQQQQRSISSTSSNNTRPRVTMVSWNENDTMVLTAISDFTLRIWTAKGEPTSILRGHEGEVYVIEPHPYLSNTVATAGHDGKIIIWDINKNSKLYEYTNKLPEGQGHGAVFDCKWSPDGLILSATDSHGHILIFNVGRNEKFNKLPKEIFFHTDYRPLIVDAITSEVIDEQTQLPVHTMPPPFLVDIDGNPYDVNIQRLVPGRERDTDEQLVPSVVLPNDNGAGVIVVDHSAHRRLEAHNRQSVTNDIRSNIDDMIEQLAHEQGIRASGGHGGRSTSGNSPSNAGNSLGANSRGLGLRRTGQIEGVRQNNPRNSIISASPNRQFHRRVIIPSYFPTCNYEFDRRCQHFDCEEGFYKLYCNQDVNDSTVTSTTAPSNSSISGVLTNQEGTLPSFRSKRIRDMTLMAAERRRAQQQNEVSFTAAEGIVRPSTSRLFSRSHDYVVSNNTASRNRSMNDISNVRRRRRLNDVRRFVDERVSAGHSQSDLENLEVPSSEEQASDYEHSTSSCSSSSGESSDNESEWGSTRTTQTAANNSNDSNERGDNSQPQPCSSRSMRLSKRSLKKNSPDASSENSSRPSRSHREEEKPGTSSSALSDQKSRRDGLRPKRLRPRPHYNIEEEELSHEDYNKYRPSDWLSDTEAKRSPYVPQIGDVVVYYRQGHQRYVDKVEQDKIYEMTKKMKKVLPWMVNPYLPAEIFVRVVCIKFELVPTQLVCLKVEEVDEDNYEPTGNHYYVRYHDLADIDDFLILKQVYDKSLRYNWNPNDRFRSLIDTTWWLGTIVSLQPRDKDFPNSKFLCYKIKWDTGEIDCLSPWDLEVIPENFLSQSVVNESTGSRNMLPTENITIYEPTKEDWPPHGHCEAISKKLSAKVSEIMQLAIAECFSTPVDLKLYPDYVSCVEYQMDLSTIKNRLDKLWYRRKSAVKFDAEFISINAKTYNRPESDIVKNSKIVKDLLLEAIDNPNVNIMQAYQRLQRLSSSSSTPHNINTRSSAAALNSTVGSSPSLSPQPGPSRACVSSEEKRTRQYSFRRNRRSSSSSGGGIQRLKSSRRNRDGNEDEYNWKADCIELIQRIWMMKDADPFKTPVDPTQYPDYTSVIDTPMDLHSIREDLLGGNYDSIHSFHKDMMRIFDNSKTYNTNKKSRIYSMTLRLSSYYECHILDILEKYKRMQKIKSNRSKRKCSLKNQKSASTPYRTRLTTSKLNYSKPRHYATSTTTTTPTKRARINTRSSMESNHGSSSVGTSSSSTTAPSTISPTRKNPTRHAALKNPFLDHRSTEELEVSKRRKRANVKRRILSDDDDEDFRDKTVEEEQHEHRESKRLKRFRSSSPNDEHLGGARCLRLRKRPQRQRQRQQSVEKERYMHRRCVTKVDYKEADSDIDYDEDDEEQNYEEEEEEEEDKDENEDENEDETSSEEDGHPETTNGYDHTVTSSRGRIIRKRLVNYSEYD